jgi:patatin-like phospholipase/acyl hydrolase
MNKRFQILSLDGGGIKGLFSAAVLAHLEEDLKVRVTDHFDLITGTSTGGIIALALASGMSPKEIVHFYVESGPHIFPQQRFADLRHLIRHKFSSSNLKKTLRNCFGEKLLCDLHKRVVIPAYNIGDDDVYLFKTPHHDRLRRDYKVPIWKAAMATSSAPTFFSSFTELDHLRLVDGGVWANNPSMVGIAEAVSMLDIPLSAIRVLSLGTTDELKSRPKCLDHGGMWHWRKEAVNVILRGQSIGANTQVQHLLGKDKVLRIDPKVPDGIFKLDKISEYELLAKAAHESRHVSPQVKDIFLSHIAEQIFPYIPYHKVEEESHGI